VPSLARRNADIKFIINRPMVALCESCHRTKRWAMELSTHIHMSVGHISRTHMCVNFFYLPNLKYHHYHISAQRALPNIISFLHSAAARDLYSVHLLRSHLTRRVVRCVTVIPKPLRINGHRCFSLCFTSDDRSFQQV
jgi:hypothetical protein